MPTTTRTFDAHLGSFKENQNAPWGRLRYTIACANLQRHFGGGALRVLDVGGGNGLDAVPLAREGHDVTLIDFSAKMLAEAQRNADANGVSIRLRQADFAAIPALFPESAFDVVLCHNVLQYVDDMALLLGSLRHAARPGGLISIISINRYSEPYRLALHQMELKAALESLDAEAYFSLVFGVAVKWRAAEELREPLRQIGCPIVGEYGVRCVCDYIADDGAKNDPAFFEQLERLELAVSNRHPYNLLGRYFQVIGRKDG